MDALTLRVNLDCLRKDSQAIINAKVGEANGRKVVFTLYEGRTAFFVPDGASVIFRAQKPDGTILYNNCVIDDGKVEYTITSQTVAVAGAYACELQIVSDGRIIYSPYVTLNVMDNLYADTEVESSNEFTELENALNKIPSLEVINSKYTKPESGIPKSDLAQDVQNSLNKADTALQQHQSLAAYRTASEQDIIDSTKQDKLIAGENITIAADGKTISAIGGSSTSIAMRVNGGYIQYSTNNGSTWNNLIAEADLKGDKGDTGPQGAQGPSGVSPTISLEETASGVLIDVTDSAGTSTAYVLHGQSAYDAAKAGGYTGTETEFAEKLAQEQLTGTTNELTPTQVYEAVSAGIPVKVQYLDGKFGIFSYTNFNAAENMHAIASNTIVYYNGVYMLGVLIGNKSSNQWFFFSTALAQKTDIPASLPNPNAITFTGAVTGSYDGSTAKTVNIPNAVTDDHINSLIDTKLGVIENGSY